MVELQAVSADRAGLHREGPVRHDTYHNPRGEPEPRLVWCYRAGSEAGFR